MSGDRLSNTINLFTALKDCPDGLRLDELMEELGLGSHGSVKIAIRDLRLALGNIDSVNLVCEQDPDNRKGQYLYKLVGDPTDARQWQLGRVQDMDSRIETMHSVAESMARDLDGRSVEGRKARIYRKGLARMREDIEDLTP